MSIYDVPTGKIGTMAGDYGMLECLYVADYGKTQNMHADFLGLHEDLKEVSGGLMPLEKKIVVTISTQYGCASRCRFCDVPKAGAGRNVTYRDLARQVAWMILESGCRRTDRLNVHFARMGEPTWNTQVLEFAQELPLFSRRLMDAAVVHPVISTMLPAGNKDLFEYLLAWTLTKNTLYKGDAGLQFSINSTDDTEREWLFGGSSLSLREIAAIGARLPEPRGRKYTLNFCVNGDSVIHGAVLSGMFDPDKWIVKLTPVHCAETAKRNGLYGPFWYKSHEESCKAAGFDVIVFIPSQDEEDGRITCGNAVLAGKGGA